MKKNSLKKEKKHIKKPITKKISIATKCFNSDKTKQEVVAEEFKTCNNLKDFEKNNNMNSKDEESSLFEQRRTNRLGAIIGILALIGAIFFYITKMLVMVINTWSIKGYVYQYMQCIMIIFFTSILILILRALVFCYCDLKRYNLRDCNYKDNDSISDEKYFLIIEDIKIHIYFLLITTFVFIPILFCTEKSIAYKISGITFIVIYVLVLIMLFCFKRKIVVQFIFVILKKLVVFLPLALLVFFIGFSSNVQKGATITVNYNSDGNIRLENKANSFATFQIQICELDSGIKIWESHIIEEKDIHKAKEIIDINENITDINTEAEAILLNSEILYSTYEFNLNDVNNISLNQEYCIIIISKKNKKRIQLINTFIKSDEYSFAKDKMEKNY